MRDDAGFGTGSAATARPSPAALIRFYLLRGVVTAMTMLSAVLLPWLVYTATKRIDLAGLVMLGEAAVRLSMSLYGGQLAHAIGGRVSFAGAQALCAAGFALFAAVLVLYPTDFTLAMTLLAAAIVVMQAGITLGNVVTEACTIALLHSGAAAVPARVRGVDLVATGCALPLGGWLVLAFDAPLAVVALGLALATGAAVAAARGGAVYDHANARIPARLSLVDRDAWRWLAGSRRTISLTLFLLAASVPITMLFGALPFLLGSRSPVDLPGWLKPTDVLFLTHYKALESIAAALVLWQWARWAGKAKDRPAAVHAAFAGYLGSLVALIAGDSAVATAFAAIALAASFSPLMVWVRTERAALVPEHNRQRVSGLLVAIDSTAYLAGALAVRYVGFDPAALTAIAAVAALLFISLQGRPELAPAARAGALVGLPPLAVKLARYRDYLALHRDIIETRLAAAVPRLGLVKRAVAPPTWTTPLAVAPATALSPIGVGLTPIVLPRALRDAGVHTARLAASAEEFAALHRPLADVRADAVLQGWSPRVLAHLLPDTSGELQSRMRVAFHRLRVDTLLRPAEPGDGATAAARFAPIEVNNGGSQGHWIASQVNRVLLAGLGVEERKVFDNPDALVTEVYEAFVDWLAAAMAPSKFARAFGRGAVPLAFVSGPYSGRMVNDVEGPRIAEFVRRRYGVAAGYFVGFANLELGRTVGIGDRAMALVKRRGRDDAESFAVWSDLYVTDCMDYVAAAVDSEDPKTRALARAFLEGRVVGISAWPGRELIENDKAHLVDKARARAMRGALGLGVADAALLEQAAPPAFPVSDEATVVARLVDEREQWVVKARFGCGGGSVIVGAKPSWPTQTLPHVGHAIAGGRVTRVSIADLARDAGVTLVLDDERRIDMSSWRALWPHLMQFVARSPGHYVAQARVEPAVFEAVIFDGKRIDSFAATTDFAAAFTVGWHGDVPRIVPTGTLCRAVPAGHPHTNITSRGALVPVMCEDEFDRLYVALGLHRETATATDVVRRAPPERISAPVPA